MVRKLLEKFDKWTWKAEGNTWRFELVSIIVAGMGTAIIWFGLCYLIWLVISLTK